MNDAQEVLLAARDELLARGWTRRQSVDPQTGAVCVSGAITMATRFSHTPIDVIRQAMRALNEHCIAEGICEDWIPTALVDIDSVFLIANVNDVVLKSEQEAADLLESAAKLAANEGGNGGLF